jgi:hypothetical protein
MANIQVPICISGQVSKLPPISFCQDGAHYFIHSPFGFGARLKGHNQKVEKELEGASTLTVISTICGYWHHGPECSYIDVYYVGVATDFAKHVEKGFGE